MLNLLCDPIALSMATMAYMSAALAYGEEGEGGGRGAGVATQAKETVEREREECKSADMEEGQQ
jgi:hypothetical protein